MTIHHGTLTEFERRLIPHRTLAGQNESWERYAADMLPQLPAGRDKPTFDKSEPLIHQGFDAGFDAAMARVRGLLNELQTEAIRQSQPGEWSSVDRIRGQSV